MYIYVSGLIVMKQVGYIDAAVGLATLFCRPTCI